MDIDELADHWKIAIPSKDEVSYEEIDAMESIFLDEDERDTLKKALWMLSYDDQAFGGKYLGLSQEDMEDINFIDDKDKKDILTAYNYSLTFHTMLNNLYYLSFMDYRKTKPEISRTVLIITVGLQRVFGKSSDELFSILRLPVQADREKGIRGGELTIWGNKHNNKVRVEFVFDDYEENIPFYNLYLKYMGDTDWRNTPVFLDKVLMDNYDPDPKFCQQIISSSDENLELDPAKGIDLIAIEVRSKDG
jgi:hypothetical protein